MKFPMLRICLASVATSAILATAGCGNGRVGDLVRTVKGEQRGFQYESDFSPEDANGTWKTACVAKQTHTLMLDNDHMTHDATYWKDDTCQTKQVVVHQTGRLMVGDPFLSKRGATVDQLVTSIVPESSDAVTLYSQSVCGGSGQWRLGVPVDVTSTQCNDSSFLLVNLKFLFVPSLPMPDKSSSVGGISIDHSSPACLVLFGGQDPSGGCYKKSP